MSSEFMDRKEKYKTERRRFPRVMVPVHYRSPRILTKKRQVSNISLAGVRIFSDEYLNEGERLELEFILPSGFSVKALARVVWIKEQPPGSAAPYDVGLEFIDLHEKAKNELKAVLEDKS